MLNTKIGQQDHSQTQKRKVSFGILKNRPVKLLEKTLRKNFSPDEIAQIRKNVGSIQTEKRFVVTVGQDCFSPSKKKLRVSSRLSLRHILISRWIDKKHQPGMRLGLPLDYNPATFKEDFITKIDELLKWVHNASENFNRSFKK